MVTNLVKEKKSGNSNYIPNNGHSWGSVVIGKGDGNITCEVCQRHGTRGNIETRFFICFTRMIYWMLHYCIPISMRYWKRVLSSFLESLILFITECMILPISVYGDSLIVTTSM